MATSHGQNASFTPRRRCSGIGVTWVAPAATAAVASSRSASGPSVIPGMIGASITPVGMPASLRRRTTSSRALGEGAPGSACRQTVRSSVLIDRAAATGTRSAAALSSGMSRVISVPLVRMEKGVQDRARVRITPGISR